MRALLLESVRELRLHDLPKPDIGAHDLLIRVKACGICGSDVHGYDGSTGRRIPPVVMGHEAAGIVEEKGSAVERFQVGDRVTFDSTVSCGRCPFCRRGEVNLCEKREVLGVSCADYRRDGAFAEFVSVPEHIVYNLPPEFSFEHAALIEAVSIVVHAAKLTGIQPGDSADPDLIPTLRHVTDGGPDIAVEVVGLQKSVTTAIESVRRGGTVTLIGNLAPNVEIPLQTVVTRQLRLLGSCASAGEYGECIALMEQGAIRVDPLISAVAPLNEGPAWFDRLYNRQPDLMKVILQP